MRENGTKGFFFQLSRVSFTIKQDVLSSVYERLLYWTIIIMR